MNFSDSIFPSESWNLIMYNPVAKEETLMVV
jgi:hypothetical protein